VAAREPDRTATAADAFTTANDAGVPILRSYAEYGPERAALRRWSDERTASAGPYRPRFMVYAGLGTPELTAERLAVLQQLGAESFLLAADLPSQLGFDPDHELAFAQVGRAGASCTTLDDFRLICSRLDFARVESLGMLANSIGHVGLAMVDCVLRDANASHVRLVMQNDPLKEFTARGTELFTPEQALRIACDCVAYALDEGRPGAALTVCSNHLDVAGAGPVVALAVAFANAFAYVDELVGRGYEVRDVLGALMLFLNERSDLFVTASVFRTARVLWADLVEERYGLPVADQPVARLMGYAHGLESRDEPLVNVPRVAVSVLGAMLGGVDYLCATGYDEALRIPSLDAAALALRTMQVVGCEHGATASLDPLDGSHKLTALDARVAAEVTSELERIEERGGALAVLRDGYVAERIDAGRDRRQRQLESGERPMIGTTVLAGAETRGLFAGRSAGELDFASVEREARERVRDARARRDRARVEETLAVVQAVAAGTSNLVPPTVAALRAGATSQEIVEATRLGFRG
jgi:methylmalonyl-CoA mutase N-terminal domain/subunit